MDGEYEAGYPLSAIAALEAERRVRDAAHELLAALKHCVIERSEWLEEARAAIAKATGAPMVKCPDCDELLAVLRDVERMVMAALSGETNASQSRVYAALKPVRAVLAKVEGRT